MPRRRDHAGPADAAALTASLEELKQSGPLPSHFVFDLDYTLWPCWVDTHVDPPLKRRKDDINTVHDRSGTPLSFFPHVPRCEGSSWKTMPRLKRSEANLSPRYIYPGSKIRHFKSIQKALGGNYEDMIFFDDEFRNAEVSRELGVHFVEVGHSGTDLATFVRGVKEWQAKRRAREGDPNAGSALL
ncbi:hypothetical protein OC844_005182 [Tilletia horrida]|nr:hypothetical protein OC844_005182 [Tilletia horrida]